jgi:hypothetical protein
MIERTGLRNALLAATSVGALLAAGQQALGQAPEIGAVVQRSYLGATAEGAEPVHAIYFDNAVFAQDLVKTGTKGSTELEFLDATRLVVGPNGEVKLDEFVYDPATATGGGTISMQVGAFRYQSGDLKNKENVKLVTPTATMTIRGTHLVIYVDGDGATEVNVIEGAVDVMACNATTAISAGVGQRVNVTSGCASSVADLRPMPKDYVPSMPGSDDLPPDTGGPDGPNDQPESGEPG